MGGIGLRVLKMSPRLELVVPILNALFLAAKEILEVDRLALRPDAARSPKVWNAASGGNSGAGKDKDSTGAAQSLDQFWVTHGRAFCNRRLNSATIFAAAAGCRCKTKWGASTSVHLRSGRKKRSSRTKERGSSRSRVPRMYSVETRHDAKSFSAPAARTSRSRAANTPGLTRRRAARTVEINSGEASSPTRYRLIRNRGQGRQNK